MPYARKREHRLLAFLKDSIATATQDEDRARREFVFNVLVIGALVLLLAGIVDDTVHQAFSDPVMHREESLSSLTLYTLFTFFAALYALSLRGYAALASYIMLAALFDLAAYMGYRWGVDLSASLLFYALTIAMAGVLIHTYFAFVIAFLTGGAIALTAHLHRIGFVLPDRSWITDLWQTDDVLVATLIFLVIATVMWLSNREIEKSLERARRSEADLMRERNSLEARIDERTQELRQAELERMSQAYRFVEFGRLAGGVFHDLMNPLAGLTLNIDRIADPSVSRAALMDDVSRAKRAATHMQNLLLSMRRHLFHERNDELFSIRQVIAETLQLIGTYAQKEEIYCRFEAGADAELFGDPIAFTQVLTNIITNAIQACMTDGTERMSGEVLITLSPAAQGISLEIRDRGPGIPEDALPRIFEPYFTTKSAEHGIGLGLSLAKRIVEKEFGGTISVKSAAGQGSVFSIQLPLP